MLPRKMETPAQSTSVWLVETLGWHVKVYANYETADSNTELEAALTHSMGHMIVRMKNLTDPIVAGVAV